MKLWIAGDLIEYHTGGSAWTFIGVFGTEALAVAACTKSSHFYAPAQLDERSPDETVEWPGVCYPLEETG